MPKGGVNRFFAMPREATRDLRGDCRKLICPSGCFATPLSSPLAKNISLVPSGKSGALSRASRAERGALANVINAARDAVDAKARFDETR
jgi:hypothetical protein